jgi:hypothetical protein
MCTIFESRFTMMLGGAYCSSTRWCSALNEKLRRAGISADAGSATAGPGVWPVTAGVIIDGRRGCAIAFAR